MGSPKPRRMTGGTFADVGVAEHTTVKRVKKEKAHSIDMLGEYRLLKGAGVPVAEYLRTVTHKDGPVHVFRTAADVNVFHLMDRPGDVAEIIHKAAKAGISIYDLRISNLGLFKGRLVVRDFAGMARPEPSVRKERLVESALKTFSRDVASRHDHDTAELLEDLVREELRKLGRLPA